MNALVETLFYVLVVLPFRCVMTAREWLMGRR